MTMEQKEARVVKPDQTPMWNQAANREQKGSRQKAHWKKGKEWKEGERKGRKNGSIEKRFRFKRHLPFPRLALPQGRITCFHMDTNCSM